MKNCLISIIIPCYNHGEFVGEVLQSIEKIKTSYPFEIIIIDDGSTHIETIQAIGDFESLGYFVIWQPNQGLAVARNNGIIKAKGKYILPLDADNKLHTNYLTKAVDILENDLSIDVIYGNPMFFGEQEGLKRIEDFDLENLLLFNYIDACALFRKTIWEKVGGYDSNMPAMGNEDWEFWLNVQLNGGSIIHLDDLCYYYRVRKDSMSVTTTRPWFDLNRKYIYGKHSEKIANLYIEKTKLLRYLSNNRFKSILKLLLGYKF